MPTRPVHGSVYIKLFHYEFCWLLWAISIYKLTSLEVEIAGTYSVLQVVRGFDDDEAYDRHSRGSEAVSDDGETVSYCDAQYNLEYARRVVD